jgi:acetyl-CoA carboxylase biotin carboxyl carrier protein
VGVVPSSASEVVAASWNGVRGGGVQLALGGHKGREVACWGQPRLVATSAFFGVGVDRFVLRAVNGSGPRTVASVVNEVAVDGSANNTSTKFEVPVAEDKSGSESTSSIASAASVFMADVANLIKLVDTRDIVELELKQKDYELVIRKKEALPPPPAPQHSSPGPHIMAHTMFPGYQPQAQPQPLQEAPSSPSAPAAPAPVPDAIPLAAEHPPMLSPMAGTFYKCPGPGEPPYVKVGDKVTKGQVVCIVEAMKLMNEIEADQSGTIVEILGEHGKPVSMESPLFVIKP